MKNFKPSLIIAVVAGLLFIPFLGGVHLFDWDEINFAESAREMIVSRDFLNVQINYYPFWEKPPLFIWFQVLSMKIFGINEFAARFPNAVCGILTLIFLFNIGKRLKNNTFGYIWTVCYASSILPFLYFKSGIIDPWFNLFIFAGIFFFIKFTDKNSPRRQLLFPALSAFFIGLAILTKGPVALIIYFLTIGIFYLVNRFRDFPGIKSLSVFILVLVLTGGSWFLVEILTGRMDVVRDFIVYQARLFSTKDAGHGGFFLYHFVVLFFGVFPASFFALPAFKIKFETGDHSLQHFRRIMLILFWVVLILFTIVKTKIVHYSSLCYFPLTFLAALFIYKIYQREIFRCRWLNFLLIAESILLALVLISLPLIEAFKQRIIDLNLIKDRFAIGNLEATVSWGITGYIGAILFVIAAFVILTAKIKPFRKYLSFALLNILFIYFLVIYVTPRVECYSQKAAVDFYRYVAGKDCYVETLGFKSYAQLFYTQKKPLLKEEAYDLNWLISGKTDKPVYFVTKNTSLKEVLDNNPGLKIRNQKNGFVFLERKD